MDMAREEIPLKAVVARAIFQFLALPSGSRAFGKALRQRNSKQLIQRIAGTLGVVLDAKDFATLIDLEANIQCRLWHFKSSNAHLSETAPGGPGIA